MSTFRTALAAASVFSFLAMPAMASTSPDPNLLYFHDNVTYGGSGCPQGTVGSAISEDGHALTIFFDEYYVSVSRDTAPNVSKTCNLSLPMHIPPGWQYSLIDVTYRGNIYLDSRVWARQKSEYYFQGNRGPRFQSTFRGPADRDFQYSDRVGIASSNFQWSPCNVQRNLNIKTRLQVNNAANRRGYGEITQDSIDAEIAHIYRLQWRRCR